MTVLVPRFDDVLVVREAGVEVLGLALLSSRFLADSDATGGALSIMRTMMGEGVEGARPHMHSQSAELFYLLDGELQLLAGERVIMAGKGDLVMVPPTISPILDGRSGCLCSGAQPPGAALRHVEAGERPVKIGID